MLGDRVQNEFERDLIVRMQSRFAPLKTTRSALTTHPNNRRYLGVAETVSGEIGPLGLTFPGYIAGMPIYFDSSLPERASHQEWIPPPEEKYVIYGPEDEYWLRPLGRGTVITVDDGPVFYRVELPRYPLMLSCLGV